MSYYFTKTFGNDFEKAIIRTTEILKDNGFGVLTEIDLKATLKKKIDVDFYNYKILGACNPKFAYQALLAEDKIGLMLPCNVIVQQKEDGGAVEVSAIDPIASMSAVQNEDVASMATEVQGLMKTVIESL